MDYNARFYSPALGRFIQPDTIIPDLTNSQAWNRYSYAYNNPISYTDPSGHFPEEPLSIGPCMDGDCSLYQNEISSHESTQLWNPALEIEYPDIYDTDGNLVAPGTPQSQFHIDEQSCGPISIAAILATSCLLGECISANEFYVLVQGIEPNVTDGLSSMQMLNVILNLTQFSATIYWNKLEKGPNIDSMPNLLRENDLALNLIHDLLSNGEFAIVGVQANSGSGRLENKNESVYHWVVVVGLSPDLTKVRIYNPFDNHLEVYSQEEFLQNWKYPKSFQREVISVGGSD